MRNHYFYPYTLFITVATLIFSSGCQNSPSSSSQTANNSPDELSSPEINPSPLGQNSLNQVIDKLALANHLQKIDAKFYGTFWCPYCQRQKELFGAEAIKKINYIECDPGGENPQPQLCSNAGVETLPTWQIQGRTYTGYLSLEELAKSVLTMIFYALGDTFMIFLASLFTGLAVQTGQIRQYSAKIIKIGGFFLLVTGSYYLITGIRWLTLILHLSIFRL